MGWLADVFRFWWGLFYWNLRKSCFRWRGGRARCPCQSPSDSGRALETACEAAQGWERPARFHRVCPLLVETPAGLRCSVDTRDVRPFWGRAGAYCLVAAAGAYVAGVLAVFVVLHAVGYPLSPLSVFWPARWHELGIARSEYFAARARRALDAHRISEAILSLDIAYHNNPRNYDAGLQLAQLTSIGQPGFADPIFATLMRDFPDRRAVTSEAWFRFLLVNGRFARVARLASARLLDNAPEKPAWMHALFNATRYDGDDKPLRDLVARQASRLELIDVALINSELLIRQGRGLQLLPGLTTELPPSAGTYGPFFQVTRLEVLGRHAEALDMLNRYAAARRIPDADLFQLRLDILADLGREDLLCARLAESSINARELELISIHLVRHPNPAALTALGSCLNRSSLRADDSTCAGFTAFFVACGVSKDWDQMHAAAGSLRQIAGTGVARFDAIEAFFRQKPGAGIETVLPLLPALSIDLAYALYDRYARMPPVAAIGTAPGS